MVDIFFEDTAILDFSPEFFDLWLNETCISEDHELGQLSLIFCSDKYLLDMNNKHLGHDYLTDILTFDYSDDVIIGDLFISIDRVRDNAIENGVTFINERNRIVVHGLLHLLGYNDKTTADKLLMTEKENHYLENVSRETL